MKKLMTAVAVCAVAGLALSQSVTSANIVGYKSDVSVIANYYTMLGTPFVPVGGTPTPIGSIFTSNTSFTANETLSSADSILVWNGTTYVSYFYSSDAGTPGAWVKDDAFTPTTDTIPVGGAFWFNRIGSALHGLTIAGQVVTTNVSVAVKANYFTMVGNPFAAAIPISSISAPDLTANETLSSADSILIWNGTTYVSYFYSSDAGTPGAWVKDDAFTPTADVIPSAGAFWFNRIGAATTITLPVPY